MYPPRLVSVKKLQEDSMSAPKQFLCQLDVYKRKFGEPNPKNIVTREFWGKKVTGVYVTKNEDEGMWAIDAKQSAGMEMLQQLNDLGLRPGQADQIFDAGQPSFWIRSGLGAQKSRFRAVGNGVLCVLQLLLLFVGRLGDGFQ